ncbi:MAG: aminotransferase class IV [Candidatus Omnitrophica bacterium]|nr:aminotransferase class IV [Candidatus Omnitrophota bacterium]
MKLSLSKISVFERGYLYGDGIFDTMRSYNGRIFRFEDHMERLKKNARALRIPASGSRELKGLILKALKKNRLKDAYIRVSLSRGKAGLGPAPVKGVEPSLTIIVRPSKVYPRHFYRKGVEILISSTRRMPPCALDGKIKSMNYLNSILAREEATRSKAFETILLSEEGYVTEGTCSNIFIVRDGKVITSPSFLGTLEGITRKVVLEIAERLGIKIELTPFTNYDIYTAEECFLTSTGIEVMPIRIVDRRIIGKGAPGKITQLIREEFLNERSRR